jgi:hypothetical protein
LSQAQPDPSPSLLRRPAFWLVVVAALLLVAVATVVGITLGAGRGADTSTSDTPTPGTAATDATTTPPAVATEAPPPTDAAVVIPASCPEIYTRDWTPEFDGLVLNPTWSEDPNSGVHLGSHDDTAVAELERSARLTCKWGHPKGGSDRGLTTNVAVVDAQQVADLRAHFQVVGYSCYEELDGVRCIVETEPTADGQSGESHFFREGVWIATLWVNAGPDGYTHDIVAALFG